VTPVEQPGEFAPAGGRVLDDFIRLELDVLSDELRPEPRGRSGADDHHCAGVCGVLRVGVAVPADSPDLASVRGKSPGEAWATPGSDVVLDRGRRVHGPGVTAALMGPAELVGPGALAVVGMLMAEQVMPVAGASVAVRLGEAGAGVSGPRAG
jgi:hypothetical protein